MSTEPRKYTIAEAFALPLPRAYLEALKMEPTTSAQNILEAYAKLKAQQQMTLPDTPVSSADDKEYYDRAVAKLFTPTPREEAEWERKRELISKLALTAGATDAELALLKQWELLPGAYDDSLPSIP